MVSVGPPGLPSSDSMLECLLLLDHTLSMVIGTVATVSPVSSM